MHNVEFKSELRDLELAQSICKAMGATHAEILEQTDTYYKVPSGRLTVNNTQTSSQKQARLRRGKSGRRATQS